MLKFTQKTKQVLEPNATLTLSFDQRNKSRLKTTLDDGRAVGIVLENGNSLKNNDILINDDSEVIIQIKAALETVSTVYCNDTLQLARACYHLGNRHVSLQIDPNFIRYQHDHVLDDMLQGLGLEIQVEHAPFEPESGAYHTTAHHHHSH